MSSPGMVSDSGRSGGVKAGDPALGGSTTPLAQPGHISLKPLLSVRDILIEMFVNRENEILAVLTSIISGEPAILIGPPGTAKTALIETLAKLIEAKYFYYLLNPFTDPNELLGPIDIRELRKGNYVRITANRLPDAEIVFLDEVFKAGSAVRNLLLDIILHKRYLNGVEYKKLPILTLYTASNEISTDSTDAAFYDRLTIRSFVKKVDRTFLKELISKAVLLAVNNHNNNLKPIVTVDYIRQLQNLTKARATDIINNSMMVDKVAEVINMVEAKGIELSDRRIAKLIIVASAISLIYGENEVSPDALAEAFRLVAPHNEDDLTKIEEVLMKVKLTTISSEQLHQLLMIEAEINNVLNRIEEKKRKQRLEELKEDIATLKEVVDNLIEVTRQLEKNPKAWRYIKKVRQTISRASSVLR